MKQFRIEIPRRVRSTRTHHSLGRQCRTILLRRTTQGNLKSLQDYSFFFGNRFQIQTFHYETFRSRFVIIRCRRYSANFNFVVCKRGVLYVNVILLCRHNPWSNIAQPPNQISRCIKNICRFMSIYICLSHTLFPLISTNIFSDNFQTYARFISYFLIYNTHYIIQYWSFAKQVKLKFTKSTLSIYIDSSHKQSWRNSR